jgi:Flp pilus assembly pilin Flp
MSGFNWVKRQMFFSACRGMQVLYQDRRAVTAIEYALIAGVITVAIVGSLLTNVAPSFNKTFATIASEL